MTLTAVILGLIFWNYGVRRLGIVISAFYLNFIPIFAILIISLLGSPPNVTAACSAARWCSPACCSHSCAICCSGAWRRPAAGDTGPP